MHVPYLYSGLFKQYVDVTLLSWGYSGGMEKVVIWGLLAVPIVILGAEVCYVLAVTGCTRCYEVGVRYSGRQRRADARAHEENERVGVEVQMLAADKPIIEQYPGQQSAYPVWAPTAVGAPAES
jgi:hypothetical protein